MKQQTIVVSVLRRVLLTVSGLSASFVWALTDSTVNWNEDSGNAAMSANYNPATAPGVGTLVCIGNGGEMLIDSDLTWGALWVGYNGSGVVRQSAGTLSVSNPTQNSQDGVFTLGYNPSNVGCYHLSGGSVVCTVGKPTIGWSGFGLLDISGGAFSATNFRSLGLFSDGAGHVDVHGNGTFDTSSTPQIIVGENGQGVITVRDGGEASIEKILVASGATSTGMVNVASGGTFSASAIEGGSGALKKLNVAGGTVKAQGAADAVTNYLSGVAVSVGAGGLVFDTNGKTVVIQSPITSSRLVADNLAHRWSFNGNANDSVGGATANANGVTYDGGEVVLPGTADKSSSSWVALGSGVGVGCIPSGKDGITIEIWTTPTSIKGNSRMFTCSEVNTANDADTPSRMFITWGQASNLNNDITYLKAAGDVKMSSGTILSPWTAGTKYHVTFVFEKRDGDWRIDICKRDALTGKPLSRGVATAPLSWDPANLAKGYFLLGYSSVSGDPSTAARFDEVRIWNIALTEDELLESTTRGPDADFSSAPRFRKTGAGVLALSSAADYVGATEVAAGTLSLCAPDRPVHRWSFENGSIRDLITGSGAATFSGSNQSAISSTSDNNGLVFPGGPRASALLLLGNGGMVPTNEVGFTIELWGTLLGTRTNSRLFSLTADSGNNQIFMSWSVDTDNNRDYSGMKSNGESYIASDMMAPYEINQPYHVAAVVAPKDGGGWTLRFYKQNVTTGTLEKQYGFDLPSGWTPERLASAMLVLAWSPYQGDDDANARYDEVRVWNRPFTEDEVVASGVYGPDNLPTFPAANAPVGSLPSSTFLTVNADASLLLGGASQTVASLDGNGSIEGSGMLTTTDAIRPGGASSVGVLTVKGGAKLVGTVELDLRGDASCDRIDFAPSASYDISGIHWTVPNLAPATSCDKFIIANAAGAMLTGMIDVSGIDSDYVIKQTSDGNLVFKRIKGLVLIIK